MSATILEQFRAARFAGVPIVAIKTADPAATIREFKDSGNGSGPPIIQWDAGQGFTGVNSGGEAVVNAIQQKCTGNYSQALTLARGDAVPKSTIFFLHNGHLLLNEIMFKQLVWNLRDPYKLTKRCLVILCPDITLPPELGHDVIVLDHPLPTEDQYGTIGTQVLDAARSKYPDLPAVDDDMRRRMINAMLGLSAFEAENAVAMSIREIEQTFDMDKLWEHNRRTIDDQPGLRISRSRCTFNDIAGLDALVDYGRRMMTGREPARGILVLDEFEKMIGAGNGMNDGGVSEDQRAAFLSWTSLRKNQGIILYGVQGGGKTFFAECLGGEFGIPVIYLDLGDVKGGIVGTSEHQLRSAFKRIESVCGGRIFMIATMNGMDSVSPELRRRFPDGTYMVDLPNEVGRNQIHALYRRKHELEKQPAPIMTGWTGAEIETMCYKAWQLEISEIEAAEYIVPVSRSAADKLDDIRRQADGKFLSASYKGVYRKDKQVDVTEGNRFD